ncbi:MULTISPECIES: hypothetical protein [Streptomyces]|uniref:Uncharacterized protein n=1 Tax=Streptomyces koelreuteriae TaxID=2838015 RepID=A0ABX8FJL9_9ACTN|nr:MULTISPECIES: hypothetical protein [Streptomyces]QWB21323.1 hypothetical protein KJK29_01375 [Streptomyces koelreuteriae]UUA04242.1 hypothetical protein NNW98_01375 [Streptomyces koelreuteriae]UUA11868.1 hypothetical protein NNW99_01375 [Streptomyces sp. CRCS-T-1]
MGLDITVLAVDWERLERTPFEERYARLTDAAAPDDDLDWDADLQEGWVWPAASNVPWCGRYEFHSTSGSYKPHFWAGQAWEDIRRHAAPEPREHLDGFLRELIWDEGTEDDTVSALFAGDPTPWRPRLLLACPPPTVSTLAGHWARVEPMLESLREPFRVHPTRPGRWIENFDEFSVLLREWGVVVTETERRGWGLVGLPL